MAYIDKLLNKFNKAKNTINSLKGIASKLESLQYESVADTLGEARNEAEKRLKDRQSALSKTKRTTQLTHTKKMPETLGRHLVYPKHDPLDNYITFDIMSRRMRTGDGLDKNAGGNFMKETKVGVYSRRAVSLYIPDTFLNLET